MPIDEPNLKADSGFCQQNLGKILSTGYRQGAHSQTAVENGEKAGKRRGFSLGMKSNPKVCTIGFYLYRLPEIQTKPFDGRAKIMQNMELFDFLEKRIDSMEVLRKWKGWRE